jgi:hypothetical protein
MALSYSGAHIAPEPVDHMKVRAAVHGIPTNRSARNASTVSRVAHGTAGSMGGGAWQQHRAAYHASTSAQQQREDQGHLESLHNHMLASGMHPHAVQWVEHWIGQHHAFAPELISFIRRIGSKQTRGDPQDQERAAARASEMQAGHQPRAAVPTHPKVDTRTSTQTKGNNVGGALHGLAKIFRRSA